MGRTTIQVSDEMADELHSRKERGDSYEDVIRRALEKADAYDAEESVERGDDALEDVADRRDAEPVVAKDADHATEDDADDLGELIDALAEDILPGSGEKLERRREALHAAVEYLREQGTATPADFKESVYPGHEADYSSGRSWWKNAMYPGLSALSERSDTLESADTTGQWRYVE